MKQITSILFSLCLLASCSQNDEPLFIMPTQTDFQIPAGLNTIETHFFVQKNVSTFFQSVSTADTSAISQIIARRATLRPIFDVLDLDYINSVVVYVLDPLDPNQKDEIFFREPIELGNKQEINLFSSSPNVKKYLVNDFMNLEVAINFRQLPTRTIDFRLDMSFSAFGFE